MERKRLIAIIIIAIVIVGVLGWYFLFATQKGETTATAAKVNIDSRYYTTPIIWNLTATPGATDESSHNITNAESNNATSMAFNYTIWHLEGNQWIEQWNGTRWFNGTSWLVDDAVVQPSIVVGYNLTAVFGTPYANKSISSNESSTYYYSLVYNDQMIYLNLNYLGRNPTVDGQTVFAYVAFDGNGNGILDASDKAFNFTNNPSLPTDENQLKIYTPATNSSWNTTAGQEYTWNGNVSSHDVPTMPITVVYSDNRTNITFAIPFNYIGATIGGNLGFVLQAFSHDWTPATANATTPANYIPASLSLPVVVGTFDVGSHTTLRFYAKATFTSAASGDYSIVFKFQATIQNYS